MLHHPNMANNDDMHHQSSQQTAAANIKITAIAIILIKIAARIIKSINPISSSNQAI